MFTWKGINITHFAFFCQISTWFLFPKDILKMSDIKQRKKVVPSPKHNEEPQKQSNYGALSSPRSSSSSQSSFWINSQTALNLLSLVACLLLTWFLFQQSGQLAHIEKEYHLLQLEAGKCQDMENKVNLISEKCEKTQDLMEQLEALQIISHVKHLQEDLYNMKTLSKSIIKKKKKEELQENLTTVFHAVIKFEQSTASIAKDVSLKIATVKTDIRRISGLVLDVTSLTDSLRALEDKVDKAEKKTVQNIGNLLTSSIDRTAKLQTFASGNSKRTEQIKIMLSDLRDDFNKHSDRLLNLESNRAKVLKTVTFANDLKPKVYNLKKDFARLEPMINELTLRIGRLVDDILQREKEIAFLNEKLSNLTTVETEIKDMKEEIGEISDMN
ncbi:inhibitor of nuclear factor kappa-B kinase-interacting protein isoform X2 [Emydura macquarii macquarii]|uniref:inhibitor of nuclear factor kappa-B kinase-interacting protein isoform X2 n=1 Tax=Emydura macquarii macquarii TaxID=1129001 RepID=UPI003529E123